MKHITLYENFQNQIELPKEVRKHYIQEIGKHATFPDMFKYNPGLWQSIVNDGMIPDDDEDIPSNYTKRMLETKKEEVRSKVWSTPQATFNNFLGHVAELDGNNDNEWHGLSDLTDQDFIELFGKQEPEVIRMMRSLYENTDIFDWIDVK